MTRLALAGASNFRDFGGQTTRSGAHVKTGMLFRSDKLSALTADDHATLEPLKFQRIFDLRRESESKNAPTVWPGPTILELPLFRDESGPTTFDRLLNDPAARKNPETARAGMRDLYQKLVHAPSAQDGYKSIFSYLAEPEHFPVVVHCSAGKDRTGVVCALILGALG
ncbi:MAG: tyrosine-protein phosphatase, partial [Caulobacterales bacterium]